MFSRNVTLKYTTFLPHHTAVSPFSALCEDLQIDQVFITFFFLNDLIYYLTESIYQTYVCLYNRSPLNSTTNARGRWAHKNPLVVHVAGSGRIEEETLKYRKLVTEFLFGLRKSSSTASIRKEMSLVKKAAFSNQPQKNRDLFVFLSFF